MMKKLLAIILFTCASAAQAAFVPGPVQVNASGGTATPVGYATGGSSVPVAQLNAQQIQASGGAITPVGYQTSGASVPVSQLNAIQIQASGGVITPVGFQTAGGSVPVVAAQGVAGASGWKVDFSTGVQVNSGGLGLRVELSTGVQVNTGARFLAVDFSSGVQVNTGARFLGVELSTGIQSRDSLRVSSNTSVPTAVADGLQVQTMGDKYGRIITKPLGPWGLVKMATATLTASTAETVLISTPAANTFANLLGCMGENTSATNTDVTFRQTNTATNNVGSFKLGFPANFVPVGFFPPGGIPQLQTGNWTITSGASVTSLNLTCWYQVE